MVLQKTHLDAIIALKPALVLLGTGEHFVMPDESLLAIFQHQKIGIECMHTRAACMTFSALSAEDRNVVAALIIN